MTLPTLRLVFERGTGAELDAYNRRVPSSRPDLSDLLDELLVLGALDPQEAELRFQSLFVDDELSPRFEVRVVLSHRFPFVSVSAIRTIGRAAAGASSSSPASAIRPEAPTPAPTPEVEA